MHELIDQQVTAGLQAKAIAPAARSSDAEFLRRVYLDLTGSIPTLGEAQAFLEDKSPIKRQQLVDRLLNSPEYARQMQRLFDVVLMERRPAKHIPQAQWEEYLRTSFAANKPWDALAREILAADGTDQNLRPAARFYLDREAEPNLVCAPTWAASFWAATDNRGFFNATIIRLLITTSKPTITVCSAFFQPHLYFHSQRAAAGGRSRGTGPGRRGVQVGVRERRHRAAARPHLPGEKEAEEPQFEKGQEYAVAPPTVCVPCPNTVGGRSCRLCLRAGENVAFRRNIANRLWSLMMGRGLVHPLDMHHAGNPPLYPALLDLLGERFAAMHFDIKAFLRELALSDTYQRSSELPPGVEGMPPDCFAVALAQATFSRAIGVGRFASYGHRGRPAGGAWSGPE